MGLFLLLTLVYTKVQNMTIYQRQQQTSAMPSGLYIFECLSTLLSLYLKPVAKPRCGQSPSLVMTSLRLLKMVSPMSSGENHCLEQHQFFAPFLSHFLSISFDYLVNCKLMKGFKIINLCLIISFYLIKKIYNQIEEIAFFDLLFLDFSLSRRFVFRQAHS